MEVREYFVVVDDGNFASAEIAFLCSECVQRVRECGYSIVDERNKGGLCDLCLNSDFFENSRDEFEDRLHRKTAAALNIQKNAAAINAGRMKPWKQNVLEGNKVNVKVAATSSGCLVLIGGGLAVLWSLVVG